MVVSISRGIITKLPLTRTNMDEIQADAVESEDTSVEGPTSEDSEITGTAPEGVAEETITASE